MRDWSKRNSTAPLAPSARLPWERLLLGKGAPREQLSILLDAARRHGPVLRFRYLNRSSVLISGPDQIAHVLKTNSRNYQKSENYRPVRLVTGNGLLTSDGEFWRRQRRLVQPAFHRHRVADLATMMVAHTDRMVERWRGSYLPAGRPFSLFSEMIELTLAIACKALFGAEVEGRTTKVLQAQPVLGAYVDSRMGLYPRLPVWLPTPANRRYRRALADLDALIYAIIDERRAATCAPRDDLLGLLLAARDERSGGGMTERHLRDEVATLLLAGSETTAVALTWTLWLLANNPPVEARLHEELDRTLCGRPPTLEDLPRLAYTHQVLYESMRLYPPAWILSRSPLADDKVGGYRIPAGTTVLISPYVTHRSPRYWGDPELFDPDRFLPERAASRPQFAYLPFGGGPRKCIGDRFATTEAVLVLARTASQFTIRPAPGVRPQPWPLVSLRPDTGVPVFLAERSGHQP